MSLICFCISAKNWRFKSIASAFSKVYGLKTSTQDTKPSMKLISQHSSGFSKIPLDSHEPATTSFNGLKEVRARTGKRQGWLWKVNPNAIHLRTSAAKHAPEDLVSVQVNFESDNLLLESRQRIATNLGRPTPVALISDSSDVS